MIRTSNRKPISGRSLAYVAACLPIVASANPLYANAKADGLSGLQDVGWTFHYENVLGTSMQLTLRSSAALTARAQAAILSSIDNDTQILSAWRGNSELCRWLATRDRPVPVSPDLFKVLSMFDHWRAQTNGAINPAAEAARRLWELSLSAKRDPSPEELQRTVSAMNQPHWHLEAHAGTATHLTSTPQTLASFTKSYIADRAAQAALKCGASGVMLNIGGDIVVRGDLTQAVLISDPLAHAENDAPIDRVLVRDRAIATSGSYRRNFSPGISHIFDPRTCLPTGHILSSTVIASDPSTAGALATAFSVLAPDESRALAESIPGTDYLLVTSAGERLVSEGWHAYRSPTLTRASYVSSQSRPPSNDSADASKHQEVTIALELARAGKWLSKRPYVAVWVEDENRLPVRTIALWSSRERWRPSLTSWYRDEQLRPRAEGSNGMDTISSATRPPGKYTLMWDGTDMHGLPVKPGRYTICIEAVREHGGHSVSHQEIDLNGQMQTYTIPPSGELGATTLDYRKD